MTAPHNPYLSPDGQWRWDGTQWVPSGYPPPSWYGGPPPARHDGKAIASLVVSLVGLCGINSVAAVILGHQSRRAARRENREPSGVALAGIVIGYVGIALAVALAGLFAFSVDHTDPCGPDCGGTAQADAAGPAAVALHDAEAAQERYHAGHGVYAGFAADLTPFGYTDPDGVTVQVLWVQDESYCMRGRAGDSTLYLDHGGDPSGVATEIPCG